MASIIKDKARVFNANQFLNLFSSGSISTWGSGTVTTINDVIVNNNRKYVATTSGITGVTPPTHVTGVLSDGGVMWQHVEPVLITNFYQNNLFMSLGRTEEWDDEQNPPQAMNYTENDYIDSQNSVFFKKMGSSNASLSIKRNIWTANTTYDSYVNNVELDSITYYVTNSSNRIYICVDNNGNSPSIAEPTDTNTVVGSFKTADGYTWKYMGEVSDINFITTDYVPVVKVLSDNGSDQWNIQQNSKSLSILFVDIIEEGSTFLTATPVVNIEGSAIGVASLDSGVLNEITLTDSGSGYETKPYIAIYPDSADLAVHQPTMTVTVSGGVITGVAIANAGQYNQANAIVATVSSSGGSGADLVPTFTDSVLTGFNIINGGSGYTGGDVVDLDDGDGNSEAHDVIIGSNINTANGLGSNILEDCNAKYIIINDNMIGDELGYLDETTDFRQVLLFADVLNNNGAIATSLRYYGYSSPSYAGADNDEKAMVGSGSQIYTDNIEVIQRTANQQENIKIILKF